MSHTNTQIIQTAISISSLLDIWVVTLTFSNWTSLQPSNLLFVVVVVHVCKSEVNFLCHCSDDFIFFWERIVSWTGVWQARLGWLGSEPTHLQLPSARNMSKHYHTWVFTSSLWLQIRALPFCGNHFTKLPIYHYYLLILEVLSFLFIYVCACRWKSMPTVFLNHSPPQFLIFQWTWSSMTGQYTPGIHLCPTSDVYPTDQTQVLGLCSKYYGLSHLSKLTFSCYFKEI